MKHLFTRLDITSDLTFKKLFKPAISKKTLLHYLDELESKRSLLLDYKPTSNKALLAALICNNPELNPKQIIQFIQLFGFKLALDEATLRELRVMFSKCNPRSWYRLMADAQKIKLPAQSPFGILREQLINFKAVQVIAKV